MKIVSDTSRRVNTALRGADRVSVQYSDAEWCQTMGATSVYPQAPDEKLMRRQSNEKNEIEDEDAPCAPSAPGRVKYVHASSSVKYTSDISAHHSRSVPLYTLLI